VLSSTLKRSVATLGVVAGLLVAVGPASAGAHLGTTAQPNDALTAAKAPTKADASVVLIGANDYGFATPQGFIMKDGNICDPTRHMGC
jgi:hypothetical protein